jgi:hypothetical protein
MPQSLQLFVSNPVSFHPAACNGTISTNKTWYNPAKAQQDGYSLQQMWTAAVGRQSVVANMVQPHQLCI